MASKTHVAVVYTDPTPTTWEKERRAEKMVIDVTGGKSDIETFVKLAGEKIKNEVEEEIEFVEHALVDAGKRVTVLCIESDNVFSIVRKIEAIDPDIVFNFCESSNGDSLQEMYLASAFELRNVRYTGAPAFTLGLAVHKNLVKDILIRNNIPTPEFWFVPLNLRFPAIPSEKFPLIVKPYKEDASIGIDNGSVVYTVKDLVKRIEFVWDAFKQHIVVERFLPGREFNVSILGNRNLEVLPISEIDYSGMPDELENIVSYEAKWIEESVSYGKTKPVCPACIPVNIETQLKDIALSSFKIIGCRHYGRIDMRLDEKGNPFVLEVNPNPDISPDAGFVRSAKNAGLAYNALINRIVDLAMEDA